MRSNGSAHVRDGADIALRLATVFNVLLILLLLTPLALTARELYLFSTNFPWLIHKADCPCGPSCPCGDGCDCNTNHENTKDENTKPDPGP